MALTMSANSRAEVLAKCKARYQGRGKQGRGRLLDEVCALCGYERKYANKLLSGKRIPSGRRSGGPAATYGDEHRAVLKTIWLAAEQPCGKRLVGVVPVWLPHYEQQHGKLTGTIRRELLTMSAASIDRLLKPCRLQHGAKRRCGTKPGGLLKQQIAVRCGPWEVTGPGWIEADTVSHCGGSAQGDFVWSVTLTDIHTQWTETRAVWNKGAAGVLAAIADIETQLPFKLRGFDSDNGNEFINWHLYAYFKQRSEVINLTRSREYRKNDNAHVEQKNWSHVRQLTGYDRLDQPQQAVLLNRLYTELWNRFRNYFCPVMKLVSKTRDGGKIKRGYDQAQTPFQRLRHCLGARHPAIRKLTAELKALNPFTLKQQVETGLRAVWRPRTVVSARPTASLQQPFSVS